MANTKFFKKPAPIETLTDESVQIVIDALYASGQEAHIPRATVDRIVDRTLQDLQNDGFYVPIVLRRVPMT